MALRKKQKLEIERIIKERRAKIAAELQHDVEKAREEQYPELAGAPVTDTGDQASADLLSDLDNSSCGSWTQRSRASPGASTALASIAAETSDSSA